MYTISINSFVYHMENLNENALSPGERKNKLIEELAKYGLQFRNDSKLMQAYIEKGEDEIPLENIVTIMREMKFYWEKTNYGNILKTYRNESINNDGEYNNQWTEEDEEKIRDKAKDRVIREYIEKYKDSFEEESANLPDSIVDRGNYLLKKMKEN